MADESKVKNIGVEISETSIHLEDGKVVGKVSALHQGQIGSIKLSLEGNFSALPLVNKGIDALEKSLPKFAPYFELLRGAVSKIQF